MPSNSVVPAAVGSQLAPAQRVVPPAGGSPMCCGSAGASPCCGELNALEPPALVSPGTTAGSSGTRSRGCLVVPRGRKLAHPSANKIRRLIAARENFGCLF